MARLHGESTLEIACDESGYEGMRLVGGMTNVFAHASVNLDTESAAAYVIELRKRIRSPAVEYKANHLLRERHRATLLWFLGSDGPIYGKAWVHLTEKPYLLLETTLDLLAGPGGVRTAPDLYRHRGVEEGVWDGFLRSANEWLRAKEPAAADVATRLLLGDLGRLARSDLGKRSARVIVTMQESLSNGIAIAPQPSAGGLVTLDPLLAAIFRAVAHWNHSGRRVAVTHDRQNTLTDGRIATLAGQLEKRGLRMERFTLVDSMSDPRVQVADFIAGVTRRIYEHVLEGQGDAEVTDLLRPYIDPGSIWGNRQSWERFGPG